MIVLRVECSGVIRTSLLSRSADLELVRTNEGFEVMRLRSSDFSCWLEAGIPLTQRAESSDAIEGTRHFENRPGVYLHRPANRHLAAGYAPLTRYGAKHVFIKSMCEAEIDPQGSVKQGKKTNQLIYKYEAVRIRALLLKIATKEELDPGRLPEGMEWSSGSTSIPYQAGLRSLGSHTGRVRLGRRLL